MIPFFNLERIFIMSDTEIDLTKKKKKKTKFSPEDLEIDGDSDLRRRK